MHCTYTWQTSAPAPEAPQIVGTVTTDCALIEAHVEVYEGRHSIMIWRWRADGSVVGVTEAGEA